MESGYSCVYCQKKFNRDDNLKRHMKSQHGWGSKQHTDGNQKSEMDLQLNQFALRHPFTLMVAASTGGGKTWFVKDLLENREQWISPAPQRIIWIYGQWQPLYAEMQRIIPGIEFVKGIPANIEDEQFLNPAIRNRLISYQQQNSHISIIQSRRGVVAQKNKQSHEVISISETLNQHSL